RIRHHHFGSTPLPAGLDYARNLPAVGVRPEAHAAHLEPPHVAAGAAANTAAIHLTRAELRRPLSFSDHRLLGHVLTSLTPPGRACPARTKAPELLRPSWPSSRW